MWPTLRVANSNSKTEFTLFCCLSQVKQLLLHHSVSPLTSGQMKLLSLSLIWYFYHPCSNVVLVTHFGVLSLYCIIWSLHAKSTGPLLCFRLPRWGGNGRVKPTAYKKVIVLERITSHNVHCKLLAPQLLPQHWFVHFILQKTKPWPYTPLTRYV